MRAHMTELVALLEDSGTTVQRVTIHGSCTRQHPVVQKVMKTGGGHCLPKVVFTFITIMHHMG